MGEDRIEQHVQIADSAQTGDITLIGKIENVIKVIKLPALWQDAVWLFFTRNWIFILVCLLVQGLILLGYLHFRNLFLIPALACFALELLVLLMLWGVNISFHGSFSRKGLLTSSLAFLASTALIGWISIPILKPQTFPPDKFGIAVAMFGEGPDYKLSSNSREISEQVYEGLCQELRQKLEADRKEDPCGSIDQSQSTVLVQQIGVIPDSKTAAWYAHRIGADIVIWGQVLTSGQGSTTIRFQIDETIDKAVNPEFPVVLPVTSTFTEMIMKELDYESDPVKIKEIIAKQTTYISSFTLGLYAYLHRDYPAAVNFFEIAHSSMDHQASSQVDQICSGMMKGSQLNCKSLALLYLYLGRSYFGMGLLTKGESVLLTGRELNPDEPAILISLALGYGSLGKFEERDIYLKEAEKAIELWFSTHTMDVNAALYDRAVIYQIWKQHSDAVIDFDTIISSDPGYYVAYLNLAQSYSELGDYPDAVQTLQKAIKLSDTSGANPAWAHFTLAVINEKFGHFNEARIEYQNAIYAAPKSPSIYAAYGSFLENQNEQLGALAAFNKVVETATDKGWAYGMLGDFQSRKGRAQEAVQSYEKAIHYKPEDELLHTKLALAYTKLGESKNARSEFEKAIALPNVSYYSLAEYAGFLYQKGEYLSAADMYRNALEKKPNDPAILLDLGQTYQSMNEPGQAIEIYLSMIDKPDIFSEPYITYARERLQNLGTNP